jgi:ketosteroid isomerase-like protein
MRAAVVAAFVASITASAALSPVTARAGSDSDTGIRHLEDGFVAAFNAKDLDRIMEIYAKDVFVFDVVPPRQYVGWDAYRADWKSLLGSYKGPVSFTLSDLAIRSDGDMGYSHSIQHLVGTNLDGSKADLTVRVSDVYRRIDGEWKIVFEHVSVPVDLATGKPDFTSAP